MKIEEFIGENVNYDEHSPMIWGNRENGTTQLILDVRGWGAIQNMFKTQEEAMEFQDKLGLWITDAINDKLKK